MTELSKNGHVKRHILPHLAEKMTDAQKVCEHEWKNVRTSFTPIAWAHRCTKCGFEIPM